MILCPGWEKVQTVLELLEDSKATYNLHPTSVLLGVDQEEPKKFKVQRNCKFLSAIEEMLIVEFFICIWTKTKACFVAVSFFVMLIKVSCW